MSKNSHSYAHPWTHTGESPHVPTSSQPLTPLLVWLELACGSSDLFCSLFCFNLVDSPIGITSLRQSEIAAYFPSWQRSGQISDCYFYYNETEPYNLSG